MTELLQTKLFQPRQPRRFLARARLEERLAAPATLTLIAAPPGFGKTSLVAAWLERQAAPAAWLALDARDDQPDTFLRYVVAALQSVEPTLGQAAQALLSSGQPLDPPALVSTLINDVAAWNQPLLLVLDDYHVITHTSIHAALIWLIDHAPPQLRVIITTRHDPPFPLARWRVRDQLRELRADDLRCTSVETAHFLTEMMQLPLSQAGIAVLAQRTEGWIAGLQLAALSLRDEVEREQLIASFSGSDRLIADYLVEEVLRQQSPPTRLFLLLTAVCQRFTAELCAALLADLPPLAELGRHLSAFDCQQQIEQLDAANLFVIALDKQRAWYRYHHLFADLLRAQLRRTYPDLWTALHLRASRWFEQHDSLDEAMSYALAVAADERACELLEQHGLFLLGNGFVGTLLAWIERLPEPLLRQRAWACCLCAWGYIVSQQPLRARAFVVAATALLPTFAPLQLQREGFTLGQAELEAQLLAQRAGIAQAEGATAHALELAHAAQALLPPHTTWLHAPLTFLMGTIHSQRGELAAARLALQQAGDYAVQSGNNHIAVTARSMHGTVLTEIGVLDEAVAIYQQALTVSRHPLSGELLPPAVYPLINLAWIHYRWNKLAQTAEYLTQAEALAQQGGIVDMQLWIALLQARKATYTAQFEQAAQWIERADAVVSANAGLQLQGFNLWIARAQLALRQHQLDLAESALRQCGVAFDAYQSQPPTSAASYPFFIQQQALYPLVAQLHILQGQWAAAAALLEWLGTAAQHFQHVVVAAQAAILQALAAAAQSQPLQSQAALERALALTAPCQLERVWLEYAPAVGPLLLAALPRSPHAAHIQALLAAPELARSDDNPAASELVEQLTEREQQILRLLAAGLNSTEIAQQLVIAPSTVRTYIKNLYSKLSVNRRHAAIERGRALGLL